MFGYDHLRKESANSRYGYETFLLGDVALAAVSQRREMPPGYRILDRNCVDLMVSQLLTSYMSVVGCMNEKV